MAKNNYVDNELFLQELIDLKRTGIKTEELHLIFYRMATNYGTINSFRNYTFIEDMITEAYINCITRAEKFDTEKFKNPFAYFTTVIHRNFLTFIAKEKKQQSKKWIELKKLVEMYRIENKLVLPLPQDILNKIDEIA